MKVLQVLPELNAGGVERGTLEIAAFLVRAGHESLVVSHGGRLVEKLEAAGSRHIALPVHRKNPLTLLQIAPMKRLIEREKPDIVHIRSRVPGWVVWLALRGIPLQERPRLVSTVHGFYSVNRYSAVMTKGERVIAVSESIRNYILENYPATAAERIRVVYRGIAPQEYHTGYRPDESWLTKWRQENPLPEGTRTLLLPGRITRLKGHEDFFRLIAELRKEGIPAHGMIAGDTHPKKRAYLAELRASVAALGIGEHISFLGHRADIREIMAVADIVMALSQQPESFGRTVLEALALGKPVVGYECGGVGEILTTLFPAGKVPLADRENLHRVTRSVLAQNPAPLPVGETFTLAAMCRGTLAVYEELAD